MNEPLRPRAKYVIGPDGSPLTIADLPAPGTKRWVIRRKAEVVPLARRPGHSLAATARARWRQQCGRIAGNLGKF